MRPNAAQALYSPVVHLLAGTYDQPYAYPQRLLTLYRRSHSAQASNNCWFYFLSDTFMRPNSNRGIVFLFGGSFMRPNSAQTAFCFRPGAHLFVGTYYQSYAHPERVFALYRTLEPCSNKKIRHEARARLGANISYVGSSQKKRVSVTGIRPTHSTRTLGSYGVFKRTSRHCL